MSLMDQQWCPTSVQVTVLQARGLRVKGKSGTNDAYAVMQVGKEKYQTSVAEKSVAPVWREEAAFDLVPTSQGGALHVHVLHRALVGPDKLLGQAVINLLQLSEDKGRNKTEWFKLLDKTGKADKDRGEVLLDIQFLRNNMTASMFDLSAAGKSRSRLSKFKDKVRGKKKETDSVSGAVPSFPQVLTDSEEEGHGDGDIPAEKDEKKKKHNMKSLFSPKSNLQRNMSQSLTTLPASSLLSESQASGVNVEASEGKKKFKFKIHKRSGSSGNKDSLQKHSTAEQSNLCINGSHVYCEEPQTRTSHVDSNFSLNSSGRGSMEEARERQFSACTEEEEDLADVENIEENMDEEEEEERMAMEEERIRRQEIQMKEKERQTREQKGKEEEGRNKREEERKRGEVETRLRREEECEKLAEEKRKLKEQERRRTEEENKQREEEEQKRMEEKRNLEEKSRQEEEEEERVRREEDHEISEEKRRLKEEESRKEDEERKRRDEERIRKEQERRWKEEERAKKEKEEHERLVKERLKLEEERKRIEAEETVKREEERKDRLEEERREEEAEKVRRAKEEQEEKRRLEEQERKRNEEKRQQEEREKIKEDARRQEERAKKEEYDRLADQKRRQEEQERIEEEERFRKMEQERIQMEEEKRRQEEEETARKEREEVMRLAEEKRRREEQERMEEEERIRKMEQERIRMEEEKRRQEEEERVRKEREEVMRLAEEKRKRKEQERMEEEERIRKIEQEMIRMEEEKRRQEEEETAKKEREEVMRLAEDKRRREEQERMEEEERIRKMEQERIRMEKEKRRQEEEERVRKEKEEVMRLAEEKRKREEQERMEEEERIRKMEQEKIKMEEEKRRQEEEERVRKEREKVTRAIEEHNKEVDKSIDGEKSWGIESKVAVESPTEDTCSNSFLENPNSSHGPDSSTVSNGQERCQSAVASGKIKTLSSEENYPSSAQREKRPAPQPPGRNQAERPCQREADLSTRHLAQTNKQSHDRDIKTASVLPRRSVSRTPIDAKSTQSLAQSSKGPAPPRPRSVEEEPSSKPTTSIPSVGSISPGASQAKQVHSLNPFDDEYDDENESQYDVTTSSDTHPMYWPPHTKVKSSKVARAPPPPTGSACATQVCVPESEAKSFVRIHKSPVQETRENMQEGASVKKDAPPTASRRLQPVKPLNPLDQQSVTGIQGEKDNKSTGILKIQDKTKANGAELKGPFSLLTQDELISLVLKQEKQLSERDHKISELEQYIDNLLVRIMEEKPSILMSMSCIRKAV